MATGGSGDVLSGVIAAILSAGVGRGIMGGGGTGMDGFLAASAGAFIHAAAARQHQFGMIAEDLPPSIAAVLGDILQ
ncbi:MAG: NAD(P)H-hydrate dehydratase [Hydrotalea sp.]|nr:NAD(P)H-hydrate dehydratase [Hydrotalea sp.]